MHERCPLDSCVSLFFVRNFRTRAIEDSVVAESGDGLGDGGGMDVLEDVLVDHWVHRSFYIVGDLHSPNGFKLRPKTIPNAKPLFNSIFVVVFVVVVVVVVVSIFVVPRSVG